MPDPYSLPRLPRMSDPLNSAMHGCCWDTFYIFAYCGLVLNPHLTSKIQLFAPLPTPTKYIPKGQGITSMATRHPTLHWHARLLVDCKAQAQAGEALDFGLEGGLTLGAF